MDSLTSEAGLTGPPLPDKLVSALYTAVALRPGASMGELAALAGISRATLHRYCGTRDNLDNQLWQHARAALLRILGNIDQPGMQPLAALARLIREHLAQGELIAFLTSRYLVHMSTQGQTDLQFYLERLDGFFFNGQQRGVFRVDITAALLTEMFVSLLQGTVDARLRGRVPRECSQMLESVFLRGIAAQTSV